MDALLAWKAEEELRHESNGFQPVAMTGGTTEHAVIQSDLAISVGGRLVEGDELAMPEIGGTGPSAELPIGLEFVAST